MALNTSLNVHDELNKLTKWQYLNAANFIVSCAILAVLLLK